VIKDIFPNDQFNPGLDYIFKDNCITCEQHALQIVKCFAAITLAMETTLGLTHNNRRRTVVNDPGKKRPFTDE